MLGCTEPNRRSEREDVTARSESGALRRPSWVPERPSWFAVAVGFASLWAVVTNFARLGYRSTGFDEPYYSLAGWLYVHGDHKAAPNGVRATFDNFEHPPLAKYLFGFAELFAGHPSVMAARAVAALATLGSAVVLGVWIGRTAGRWIGLGAATLVAVLPMSVPGLAFSFGRYAYLDVVAEVFAISSVALAWVWFRRDGQIGWRFAVATGVAVGLATACKENAFLGAIGPIVAGLVLTARQPAVVRERLVQTGAAVVAACLVFLASYAVLGHPVADISYLIRYQTDHARLGHLLAFDGRVAYHPPWWAFLWLAQHGLGAGVSVIVLVCATAALVLRRDRLVLWCATALAGPLVFHMFLARVILPYYWVMWMPALLGLVALGVGELVGLARSADSRLRVAGPALAGVCVAVLMLVSLQATYRTLTQPPPPRKAPPVVNAARH